MHLTLGTVIVPTGEASTATLAHASFRAAGRTALRILVASRSVERLVVGTERKVSAALSAGKGSVSIVHAFFHLWSGQRVKSQRLEQSWKNARRTTQPTPSALLRNSVSRFSYNCTPLPEFRTFSFSASRPPLDPATMRACITAIDPTSGRRSNPGSAGCDVGCGAVRNVRVT